MIARKSSGSSRRCDSSPDKFRVGQKVMLVNLDGGGWEQANGEIGVVIAPKIYAVYQCGPLEGDGRRGPDAGARYGVRWRRGLNHFCESQLRAIYDGEQLSTWERFRKATGIRIGVQHSHAETDA